MKRVIVQRPEPNVQLNSTELLESLGYRVLPTRPGVVYRQGTQRFIHAGGKRGGYAPVTD